MAKANPKRLTPRLRQYLHAFEHVDRHNLFVTLPAEVAAFMDCRPGDACKGLNRLEVQKRVVSVYNQANQRGFRMPTAEESARWRGEESDEAEAVLVKAARPRKGVLA